jgi:7,8-dihydroneopterin aldolase/epimerase/oxygenase
MTSNTRLITKQFPNALFLSLKKAGFFLVEKLIEEIAAIIRNEFNVPWVKITLNKKGAISGASDVGIIIERGEK